MKSISTCLLGIVCVLLVCCLNSTFFYQVMNSSSESKKVNKTLSIENKYIILKLDDFGLDSWNQTVNLFINNTNYIGDLGVIGKSLQNNSYYISLLNQLLNTSRIEIFNHGWDHNCPEFANRSYDYQFKHITQWNTLISKLYNISSFILGAPCNSWDSTTFQVMAATGYKVLFFSEQCGLNITQFYADNLSLSDISSQLSNYSSVQTLIVQVHLANTLFWKNITQIKNFLDLVYSTGRKGINMGDYYNQIYLKNEIVSGLYNPTKTCPFNGISSNTSSSTLGTFTTDTHNSAIQQDTTVLNMNNSNTNEKSHTESKALDTANIFTSEFLCSFVLLKYRKKKTKI